MRSLDRTDATLLVLFLALLTFPLQYALRAFDDNTLTNWRWIFEQTGPVRVLLLLVPAIGAALILSRARLPERSEPVVLFVFACCAVVPLWSEPELIIDASRYFLQAAHLEREGIAAFFRDWGGNLAAWTDLPLMPFLYGLLFTVLGEHRIVIQCFTTFLFACSVVLTSFIGGRLWDRETGFLAGLLLLGMPYLLIQVPLMLVDVPTLFLVTLSVHAYLTALDRGGPVRASFAAIAIAGAALAKFSAWPMLLILPLITVVRAGEGNASAVRRSVAVLAGAAVLACAVLLPQRDVLLDQLAMLHTYQWPALGRWKEGFASTFLFQMHPFIPVLACIGAWRAFRTRDPLFLVPGWFAVFLLALQVERIRYILPLLPLLALMAAYGLRALFQDIESIRFAAYSAVAASLVLLFSSYQPFLDRTTMANLRDAGAYLDSLPGNAVLVQVVPQSASAGNTEMAIPLLDLHTRKRLLYDHRPLMRPDEQVLRRAPLRFTWEQRLPARYAHDPSGSMPLAVISDGRISAAAPQRSRDRQKLFAADTGTFRYRTAVTVFP